MGMEPVKVLADSDFGLAVSFIRFSPNSDDGLNWVILSHLIFPVGFVFHTTGNMISNIFSSIFPEKKGWNMMEQRSNSTKSSGLSWSGRPQGHGLESEFQVRKMFDFFGGNFLWDWYLKIWGPKKTFASFTCFSLGNTAGKMIKDGIVGNYSVFKGPPEYPDGILSWFHHHKE